ncbi:DEKNAAC102020 [Brettanomyces naardenensis]|uniref:Acyl carrier protein n=1 Tax=Brettanomyces naardenensis TaxID=13370 RepID=A0A448YJI2_BRENA|nr:DEKNAAC102020 [Brettanomyces naardenensis]
MFRQFTFAARSSARLATRAAVIRPAVFTPVNFMRLSSTGSPLTREDVIARTISVLKTFELKNSTDKIDVDTQFTKDLGMDSLDYNDALVALEEEFDVVFDDKTANEIKTVGETVDYVLKTYIPEQEDLDKEVR